MKRPSKPGTHPDQAKEATAFLRLWRSRSPVIRFGLTFAALMAAYYAVAVTSAFDAVLFQILRANAVASCKILNVLGMGCTVIDTAIRSPQFAINVRRGCDAIEPMWFFAAAVLSFPAPFSRKLVGILLGGLVIAVANVGRIASLFAIGAYYPKLFPAAHLEVWPAALILLACFLLVGWITWMRRDASNAIH
jgi:exosortase/archaeosortase family protein